MRGCSSFTASLRARDRSCFFCLPYGLHLGVGEAWSAVRRGRRSRVVAVRTPHALALPQERPLVLPPFFIFTLDRLSNWALANERREEGEKGKRERNVMVHMCEAVERVDIRSSSSSSSSSSGGDDDDDKEDDGVPGVPSRLSVVGVCAYIVEGRRSRVSSGGSSVTQGVCVVSWRSVAWR
jgi:hypothetical protein